MGGAVVLNVTGNVDVQSQGVQIGSQTVNMDAKETSVQAGQASINTQGEMPVNVAGDLKADKTHVTMEMPPAPPPPPVAPAPPKNIVIRRDESGRIVGADITDKPEA
jgi:hypothetical protein